jgi:phosphorylcholine metabolism protein LicD
MPATEQQKKKLLSDLRVLRRHNPKKWLETVKSLHDMANGGKGKVDSRGNSMRTISYRNWQDEDFVKVLIELGERNKADSLKKAEIFVNNDSRKELIHCNELDNLVDEDLNNVTLLIKSFKRKECVDNLIASIRKFYKTVPIMIVDDSVHIGKEELPNFDYDENIKTYNIDFDSGVSYGRNYGISKIKTDYFVTIDDDFEFTSKTDLKKFLKILKFSNLDVLGGLVFQNKKSIDYFGMLKLKEKTLIYEKDFIKKNDFYTECNLILQFFIAKTSAIQKNGWNNELKTGEHLAFFYDNINKIKVGYTELVSINHLGVRDKDYSIYRNRAEDYFNDWACQKGIEKVIKFDKKTILIQSKKMNKKIALENLLEIKKEFEKNQTSFWLTDGTLLGAFREGDFISHDSDTDIGVFASDMKKISLILNNLKKQNFEIIKSFGTLENGFEIAIKKNDIKTDLFFFYETEDKSQFFHSAYADFKNESYQKFDFFYDRFEIASMQFLNHNFPCPFNTQHYLIQKYGQDFLIPKIKWCYWKDPKNVKNANIRIKNEDANLSFKNFLKLSD